MKKNLYIIMVCILAVFLISGCSKTWRKMYGGSGWDRASSIQQTSDGGYIVAGSSYSTDIPGVTNHGDLTQDCYIIKLDADGEVLWQNMFGGSEEESAYSIQQTSDGGYIVAGSSSSTDIPGVTNHGSSDFYIIKLDADGNVLWQNMYGGSDGDGAYSIQQTSDGGYIVAGQSGSTDIPGVINHGGSDFYIIKLDANGEVLWQNMYGGSENLIEEAANSIQQTSDGGYIVAGWSESTDIPGVANHGHLDFYIIKLDAYGNVLWQNMYGGSGWDSANSIQQTSDGGYIVAGASGRGPMWTHHFNFYIIKLNTDGNVLWQNMYGGSDFDGANSIQQTSDGGYIVAGRSGSTDIPGVINHGYSDFYVIKLNALGYWI